MPVNMLTLGSCLSTLYTLSRPYFRNQTDFFKSFFASFHIMMSEKLEIDFKMNQAKVSQILGSRSPFPGEAFRMYVSPEGDALLKADIEQHLHLVAATNKRQTLYLHALHEVLINSTNLNAKDKQHLLDSFQRTPDDLHTILFQMVWMLLREPANTG